MARFHGHTLDRTSAIVTFSVEVRRGSFHDRYLVVHSTRDINLNFLFGHGISTTKFQEFAGANGISLLMYSIGVFGLFLVFIYLCFLQFKYGLDVVVWVLISFSSYPLITYFYWWAWLALLLCFSNKKNSGAVERYGSPGVQEI